MRADAGTLADALTRIDALETAKANLERQMLALFDVLAAVHDYAGLKPEAALIRGTARPGRVARPVLSVVRDAG